MLGELIPVEAFADRVERQYDRMVSGIFLGISGIHRFITGEIGMGILYLFTAGLCLIGTIVDLVNHQKLAFDYNRKVAEEVLVMMR